MCDKLIRFSWQFFIFGRWHKSFNVCVSVKLNLFLSCNSVSRNSLDNSDVGDIEPFEKLFVKYIASLRVLDYKLSHKIALT